MGIGADGHHISDLGGIYKTEDGGDNWIKANANIEFRNYPNTDLHDRYIISPSSLVILGYSMKDLGGKESFAIVLNENIIRNMVETLSENFNRRWEQSSPL